MLGLSPNPFFLLSRPKDRAVHRWVLLKRSLRYVVSEMLTGAEGLCNRSGRDGEVNQLQAAHALVYRDSCYLKMFIV